MNNYYQFTLILNGVDENTTGLEDALFESGCDDALINFKNGTVYLDFDRESENIETAIISAIHDIESSTVEAQVRTISAEYLLNSSAIANKTGLTRQGLSNLIKGKRGPGDFPPPLFNIDDKSPMWRWSEVASWLYNNGYLKNIEVVNDAQTIDDINRALEIRNNKTNPRQIEILNKLEHQVVHG